MSDKCESDHSDTVSNECEAIDSTVGELNSTDVGDVGADTINEISNEETPMEIQENEEASESKDSEPARHAPKRRLSVITISDSESDDSSVCHIDSYQASVSEAKKIRGDYSSASDSYSGSSGEDSDDENDDSLVITPEPSLLSNRVLELKPRASRLTKADLNPCFLSDDLDEQFLNHWSKMESFKTENLTLYSNPFRICILDHFLDEEDIVNNIVDDITTLDWSRSKMDLYEFHRSSDLVNLSWQRGIKSFYELLNDVVMKWVARITKQKLTHVSASCALYGPGDHLLVHDDLMSDRKVAFIYYLAPWDIPVSQKTENSKLKNSETALGINETKEKSETIEVNNENSKTAEVNNENSETTEVNKENSETIEANKENSKTKENCDTAEDNKETKDESCDTESNSESANSNSKSSDEQRPIRGWSKSMGGELEFFTVDSKGLPTVAVKSLLPCNNTFAFFKVGCTTFHQVSEVLSFDFPRLTINGWFHGPPDDGEEVPEHVEEQTDIPYKDLAETPHTDLVQISMNDWITSTYLSPRTKFKIQQQIERSSEISLEEFFLEDQFDTVVNNLKDESLVWQHQGPAHLRHHDILPIDSASEVIKQFCQLFNSNHFVRLLGEFTELRLKTYHSLQIQRWTAGNYTVLPPKSHYSVTELDVIVYLGLPPKSICGGSTVYLAPEEAASEPLITVEMANNSLNLVYSDSGTSKFTKYVSKLSLKKDEYFYMVTCSYRE